MQFAQRIADSVSACRSRLQQMITESDAPSASLDPQHSLATSARQPPGEAAAADSSRQRHCELGSQPTGSSAHYVVSKVSGRRRGSEENDDDDGDDDVKARQSSSRCERPRSLSRPRANERPATGSLVPDRSPNQRSPSRPFANDHHQPTAAIAEERTRSLALSNERQATASRLCSGSSETGDERPKRAVRVCESVCPGAMQRSLQSAARRGAWKTAKAASLIAGGRDSPLRAAPINENEVLADAHVHHANGGAPLEPSTAARLKRLTSDARTDSVFDDCQLLATQQPPTTTATTGTTSTSCSTSSSYGSRNSSVSSRSPLSLNLPRPAFAFDLLRARSQPPTDTSARERPLPPAAARSIVGQLRGNWTSASACSSPSRARLPCPSEFLQRSRPSNMRAIRLEELDPALYLRTLNASKSHAHADRDTSVVGQVQLAIQFERDLREVHVHLFSVQLGASAVAATDAATFGDRGSSPGQTTGRSPSRGFIADGLSPSGVCGCPEADRDTSPQSVYRAFRAIQSAQSTPRHRQSITPCNQSLLASVLQHQQSQAHASTSQMDLQRSWLLLRATLDPSGVTHETAARRPTLCRSRRRRTSIEFGAGKAAASTATGSNTQCSQQGARVRFEESSEKTPATPPREREHKPLGARRSANESASRGEQQCWTCSWDQTLEFPLNPSTTAIGALSSLDILHCTVYRHGHCITRRSSL